MTPQRSGFDWIGEAICLAGLAAAFGEVIANWSDLPARVPRHFGISGLPDGWGARTGLWLAPAIAAGLYLMITQLFSVALRRSGVLNLPPGIDANSAEVGRLLLSMSIMLKLALVLVFLYISWIAVGIALGHSAGLGKAFLPISPITLLGIPAWYLLRLRSLRVMP
jgi:uncharacterized membrane protein